ncbi:hypothetical protein CAEBREN_30201 [Caenorhabditis brenneri]|uniref:Uncharacterized protein n=1 Tax=Caenorhabditis brenneri TaxID=135651 RepID=G0NK06_CAEBE|nr:hypothetical protein CAEBREN_30201 [Caenorhabditis brenneri]
MPIQNDREASASMEQLKSLQLHRHWHQHIPPFPCKNRNNIFRHRLNFRFSS